ncbi:MAG: BON domain-containing protein [Ginsengibacter sp.]
MKFIKNYLVLFVLSCALFIGCKPKDSDVKSQIEKALQAVPETSGVTVQVTDGVATLSGEVKDQGTRDKAGTIATDTKGVKSVDNQVTVTPPVVEAPVQINPDAALVQGVKDATKDFPTVTANISDGVITLTGDIKRSDLKNLMMSLSTLKPKKIDNQLTIK